MASIPSAQFHLATNKEQRAIIEEILSPSSTESAKRKLDHDSSGNKATDSKRLLKHVREIKNNPLLKEKVAPNVVALVDACNKALADRDLCDFPVC